MHSVLLTILVFSGAQPMAPTADQQPYVAPVTAPCEQCGQTGQCDQCGEAGCASNGCIARIRQSIFDHLGPMPQTCYAPRFGCYPGNNRHMHRYPAFHGTYYREPYNYRNYFDYPWHAEPHEPMGYFTYQQRDPSMDEELQPIPADAQAPAVVAPPAVPVPPAPPVGQAKQLSSQPLAARNAEVKRRAKRW